MVAESDLEKILFKQIQQPSLVYFWLSNLALIASVKVAKRTLKDQVPLREATLHGTILFLGAILFLLSLATLRTTIAQNLFQFSLAIFTILACKPFIGSRLAPIASNSLSCVQYTMIGVATYWLLLELHQPIFWLTSLCFALNVTYIEALDSVVDSEPSSRVFMLPYVSVAGFVIPVVSGVLSSKFLTSLIFMPYIRVANRSVIDDGSQYWIWAIVPLVMCFCHSLHLLF